MKIDLQSTSCFRLSAKLHRDCATHIQGQTSFLSITSLKKILTDEARSVSPMLLHSIQVPNEE